MYNQFGSTPVLINCAFINSTAGAGGAMQNSDSSSLVLRSCTISGNQANGGDAGAARRHTRRFVRAMEALVRSDRLAEADGRAVIETARRILTYELG